MDLTFLQSYTVAVIVGLCLVTGYIFKKWVKDLENKWIPTLVTILGISINMWINKSITPEIILAGAFSGLASTGLHQLFKQLLEKDKGTIN